MKVLLSDGSGLTSRQLATILSRKRHEVHALCPPGLSLTKLTRRVTKTHVVPPFGPQPYRWLDAALTVAREEKIGTIVCAQEQVAVLSAEVGQIRALGIKIAVPSFPALARVMDKISASQTLQEAGLRQPESAVVASTGELLSYIHLLPAYIKTPIGTASKGVIFAESAEDLQHAVSQLEDQRSFKEGGQALIQRAVSGQLLMVQSVFSGGTLLSWHACLRVREGPSGGAAKKTSLPLPAVKEDLVRLGALLEWDGALSLDAIIHEGSCYYIDVNPRIVEPMNALLSGVDLVDSLLKVSDDLSGANSTSMTREIVGASEGKKEVSTHQYILAAVKAVERGRFALVVEALHAIVGTGEYADSSEELTPAEDDPLSVVVVIMITILLLVDGLRLAQYLDRGTVSNYALSLGGWSMILDSYARVHASNQGQSAEQVTKDRTGEYKK
ncbi:Glutathione synthetase ATP-binding domain-like protein [Pleurostoma richardsiae]|uniref:Glutathione synthetase ATP-binding domain-like protein n=1 Tax=Pleurostoma richardsiae TaxID=41990 RepID=A0AA38VDI0_9PEZI|nr:Glutathione synthetase ATP-binding domain-like protein [Pleurostoma richardsiae]